MAVAISAPPHSRLRFEDILEQVERYNPAPNESLLRRAYIFSAKEHKGQVRRSGEPYLVHPLNVASILADWKLDDVSVVVGLLHDVLEDTLTTRETIEEYFGPEVAHLVDGVTKISQYRFVSKEEQQAETFRKMLLAMVDDLRVMLVKLADRLHNMRTLQHMSQESQKRIAAETLEIYAPIANRLGMGQVKGELEDLAFKYLKPREFRELVVSIEERMKVSGDFIEGVRSTIASKLEVEGLAVEVGGRVKRYYSIFNKLLRQGIEIAQLYDYIAFRVITPKVADCYAALGILHQQWRPVPGRIKDYIAMPKPNLYQSLHTTLIGERGTPFEVQIRTLEMDEVAEHGIAAHWKYKEGRGVSGDERFNWLRKLIDWQQDVKDPRAFMTSLKLDLYPDEVYTFTPKGDVIAFPRGATPIDFAYNVHTEVGNRCVGARINGKLVPLRTELHNGDIVEILTRTDQVPSRDWLAMAATSRAKNKIRHWINTQQKSRSIEMGRKLFEKEAKRLKLSLKKLVETDEFEKMMVEAGYPRIDELHAAIGFGKADAKGILVRFVTPEELERSERADGRFSQVVKKLLPGAPPALKVKGHGDLLAYLAKCCNPLPGEEIVGYITRGKGVSVHSISCPNVKNLMYNSDREIDVQWAREKAQSYKVEISIQTEDKPGVLAKVTSAIAGLNSNIHQIEARTLETNKGTIDVVLEIADMRHFERLLNSIRSLEGVHAVERKYNTLRP